MTSVTSLQLQYDVTATVYYFKACFHATVTVAVRRHRHSLAASKITPIFIIIIIIIKSERHSDIVVWWHKSQLVLSERMAPSYLRRPNQPSK